MHLPERSLCDKYCVYNWRYESELCVTCFCFRNFCLLCAQVLKLIGLHQSRERGCEKRKCVEVQCWLLVVTVYMCMYCMNTNRPLTNSFKHSYTHTVHVVVHFSCTLQTIIYTEIFVTQVMKVNFSLCDNFCDCDWARVQIHFWKSEYLPATDKLWDSPDIQYKIDRKYKK